MTMKRALTAFAIVFLLSAMPVPGARAQTEKEQRTAAYFDSIKSNPLLLYAFLRAMPKGGDLHNHPSGSEYAEQYILYAAQDGVCVLLDTMTLVAPPCDAAAGKPPMTDALSQPILYRRLVDSWSMRGQLPGSDVSPHDQFFDTFDRFGLASGRLGEVMASIRSRAAAEGLTYLELMFGVDRGAASALGARIGWNDDLAQLHARYEAEGLQDAVAQARSALDAIEARTREVLMCDSPAADPGCQVTTRYLQTGTRVLPPERVFAQFAVGFGLVQSDPRVVGVNLVAPEDYYVPRRDYRLHMQMLNFLHGRAPGVPIALHAGELAPGLVPPEDLRFHIREAVQLAHARRIGHGVDVFYEDDPFGLIGEMAGRNVLVEIALSSNTQILGVQGSKHPFLMYRSMGVPVTLVTDDMGVSRSNMTEQYQQAVEQHGLDYPALKHIARTSLQHAFLPGPSLWADMPSATPVAACGDMASDLCQAWLQDSERARLQWRLEQQLSEFEARF
jgi:hypothetical protein